MKEQQPMENGLTCVQYNVLKTVRLKPNVSSHDKTTTSPSNLFMPERYIYGNKGKKGED